MPEPSAVKALANYQYQPAVGVVPAEDQMFGDVGPTIPSDSKLLHVAGMLANIKHPGWYFATTATGMRSAIAIVSTAAFGIYRTLPLFHYASAQFIRSYARAVAVEHRPNRRFALVGDLMFDLYRDTVGRPPRLLTAKHTEQVLTWSRLRERLGEMQAHTPLKLVHALSANFEAQAPDDSQAWVYGDSNHMFEVLMKNLELEEPADWPKPETLTKLRKLISSTFIVKQPKEKKQEQPKEPKESKPEQHKQKPHNRRPGNKNQGRRRSAD